MDTNSKNTEETYSECIDNAAQTALESHMCCEKCSAQLNPGAKFCTVCGAQAKSEQSAAILCTKCSAPLKPGALFCTFCGTKLEQTQAIPLLCTNCFAPIKLGAQFCTSCGAPATSTAPKNYLSIDRGLLKFILLSVFTFGIYELIEMYLISRDINTIASRYDGKKTMNFIPIALIFSWLTLMIAPIVWFAKLSSRIGNELKRRGICYDFDANTFWLWNIFGSLIIVGPLIYMHKLFKAMNLLCENYNVRG